MTEPGETRGPSDPVPAGAALETHTTPPSAVAHFAPVAFARNIDISLEAPDRLMLQWESHAIQFGVDSEFLMVKSLPYDPADPDTIAFVVPD